MPEYPIVSDKTVIVTVYVFVKIEEIIDIGALFIAVILCVRSPQKVIPSPFPHAKLTESAVKKVTVKGP